VLSETLKLLRKNDNAEKERSKMRPSKIVLVSLLTVFLGACVSVGKNFPSEQFSWIQKNETDRKEVEKELGDPFRTGIDDGLLTWTYGYYRYSLCGQTKTKDLVIYFNKDGTVSSYTFNTSFPDEKKVWKNKEEP